MALSASPLSTQAVAKSRATLAGLDEALVGEKRDATRPEVLVLADGLTLSISPSAASLDDEGEKKAPPPVKIEKVVNAWGSAAGAGASEKRAKRTDSGNCREKQLAKRRHEL
uniref:Uncharacterized protein n=1 Tax=Toxoplasma gondii TgCATBr9 TaxID=943120 RepID=A0A2T6J3F2_TOXGO|nr:hypothetical protein TGBR9_270790 [Toxoplasma gondii TgCATBr9]